MKCQYTRVCRHNWRYRVIFHVTINKNFVWKTESFFLNKVLNLQLNLSIIHKHYSKIVHSLFLLLYLCFANIWSGIRDLVTILPVFGGDSLTLPVTPPPSTPTSCHENL